jgi:NADPH:quinone reductase-like Zn-dependent oxidoreductase/acyl carrier protein
MQSLPTGGAMAALFCSRDTITPFLTNYQQQVEIAAVNSPTQILVSGDKDAIARLCEDLATAKIDSHILTVSHAFHSYLMDDILSEFKTEAERVQYNKPANSIVSNLSGKEANDSLFSSQYWVEHIRRPVEFSTGMQTIEDKAIDAYIEIGPEPILLGLAKQNTTRTPAWLASLRKSVPDQVQMYRALAGLYILGADIQWKNVFANKQAKWSTIPNYPFQRKRHWQAIAHRPSSNREQSPGGAGPFTLRYTESPLLDWDIVSGSLSSQTLPLLNQHQVLGKTIFAAASYISLLFESAQLFSRTASQSVAALTVRDVLFELPLVIPEVTAKHIQLAVEKLDSSVKKFKLISLEALDSATYSTHASGSIELNSSSPQSKSAFSRLSFESTWATLSSAISKKQIYQQLEKSHIKLGDAHQWLNEIRLSDSMALATLSMPTSIDSHTGMHDGFILHPGLLDSCFCLFASLINPDGAKTLVPFAVESFHLNQHVTGTQFFAIATLRDRLNVSGKTIGDIDLFDDRGQLVGQCLGIEGREVSLASLEKLLQDTSHSLCFGQGWESRELANLSIDSSNAIVFFTAELEFDQVLCQQLRAAGHRVTVIKKGSTFSSLDGDTFSVNPQVKEQFIQLSEALSHPDNSFTSVIYGWGLDTDGSLEETNRSSIEPLLYTLQTLIGKASEQTSLQLFILTANAQFISAAGRDAPINLQQSILSGVGKNIPLEYPQVKCAVIDLDSTASASENSQFVCQHVEQAGEQACRLTIPASGSLGDLAWQACERAEPQPGEVEIEVHATGLNFKDVLLALHRVPAMGDGLGVECAGRVVKLGPGVTEFTLGERVLAMVPGSLSRFICAPVATTVSLPGAIEDRAAATIPITFLTAAYALESLAHLQPGERVLIHAATGGVGQAAIQIAQAAGAVVFATASQGKWQILKDLGVEHIFDSRTTEFETAIQALTHGEGLDVVLNSLRGEFTDASLRLLRAGGRFLEIGITDLRTPEQIAQFSTAIQYFPIDLMVLYREQRHVLQALLRKLLERFATDELKPLPYQTFAAEAVETAFRTMQQAKHTGKVIIDMQQQAVISNDPNDQYLILGGLGDLGLSLANWLVEQRAQHICLVARSTPTPDKQAQLDTLREAGATITVLQADITAPNDVARFVRQLKNSGQRLRGIFHCASVLDDGVLSQQSTERFDKVLRSKIDSAWLVHQQTLDLPLDVFVLFSSATALLGAPGQTNYAAANAFLDSFAQYRRATGRAALAINWGAWAEIGLAARMSSPLNLAKQGIRAMPPRLALAALSHAMHHHGAQLGVFDIDWRTYQLNKKSQAFLAAFQDDAASQARPTSTSSLLNDVATANAEERAALILQLVEQNIVAVLSLPKSRSIDRKQGFLDMGMDSLTAVELKNRLNRELMVPLPATLAFDYPNTTSLANYLVSKINEKFPLVEAKMKDSRDADTLAIEQLSEQEAAEELRKTLKDMGFGD